MQLEEASEIFAGLLCLAAELRESQVDKGFAQAALDVLSGLVYAIDADGRLVIANACGARQLASNEPFCLRAGLFRAAERDHERRLSLALQDVRRGIASGFRCIAPGGVWLVRVLPIASTPGAAVVYATSAERAPVPAQVLKQMLGFTTAEAEVAYLMADGWSAKEIADARHVSITTIRTQIREVFRKAGVGRQADLTRLLFSVPRTHDPEETR